MLAFIITISLVLILLLLEVPVGFAFGVGAIIFGIVTGTDVSFSVNYGFSQVSSFSLLALPLFVLAGTLMGTGGVSERLLDFINAFVGRTRGGLGAVTVIACAFFGAISGSASAAIAAIGKIMVPKMIDEGYPPGHATALVAVSSVLALMIPPSITMIVFAIATRQSVAECFLATMVPGIMLAIIYAGLNFWFLRGDTGIKVQSQIPNREKIHLIFSTGKRASLALLMPAIVLGGIYGGIATPTESGAVALIYTLIVGTLVYRQITFKRLAASAHEAAVLTGSVMMVLFFLFILSRGMILAQIPNQFADLLLSISDNRILILLMINLMLLLMGMVVDDVSGSALAAIILMPVAQQIGIDPIHFAAIVGTNLGLGNITPPTAPLLYMAGGVTKIPLEKYIGPAMKFLLLGHFPMVFIVTFIPQVSLILVDLYRG